MWCHIHIYRFPRYINERNQYTNNRGVWRFVGLKRVETAESHANRLKVMVATIFIDFLRIPTCLSDITSTEHCDGCKG